MKHPYGSYTPDRHLPLDQIVADVERQAQVLGGILNCTLRPDLDWVCRVHTVCPEWVEKFFVTVPWQTIAPTYAEAVIAVLALLGRSSDGAFENCRGDQIAPEKFQQYAPTAAAMKKLFEQQKSSSTLIIPGQLGLRHYGRSVRKVREVMQLDEFGLGTFVFGTVLLGRPGRLGGLNLRFAGDEFIEPSSFVRLDSAPCFYFDDDGEVGFGAYWFSGADDSHGSPSGFVPQL